MNRKDMPKYHNFFIPWAVNRVKNPQVNKNVVAVCTGDTGSGKTYAMIDYAIKVSQKARTHFSIENNVAWDFEDLLNNKMEVEENKKPGTVFIYEETGVTGGGANAREWRSKFNQGFSSVLQTFRQQRSILLMTVPRFTFLDKQVRQLVKLHFSMSRVMYNIKISQAMAKVLQTNDFSGDIYTKCLRINVKGVKTKIKHAYFEMPPPEVINVYEQLKLKFRDKLRKKLQQEKAEVVKKGNKFKLDMEELFKLKEAGANHKKIANYFGCSLNTITRNIRAWKNKQKNTQNLPNIGSISGGVKV